MKDGFVLKNLFKHKRWRAHRVIAKQQQTGEHTHPVRLKAAEK